MPLYISIFLILPFTTFLGWFSQIPCLVGYFQIPWEVTSPSHPLFLPRAVFEWNQRSHRSYNVRSVRKNPLTNYLCLCFIWQHKCTALPHIFLRKMETTFSPCQQQFCHVCASFIWNCDRLVVELVKMYSLWLSVNGWKQSQSEWCESVPSKTALWLVAAMDSASVERQSKPWNSGHPKPVPQYNRCLETSSTGKSHYFIIVCSLWTWS